MTRTRSLFAVSFGVALAAACGGSTSNSGNSDGGGSGNSSGGSGSSGAGASSSSGAGVEVDGGIPCGQNSCVSPQVCCYTQGDAGGGAFAMAVATCADSCPDGGVQISCTSSAQCQGSDVCCSSFGGAGGGAAGGAITCAAQCSGLQLCATDSECLNGGSCVGGAAGKICLPDGGFTIPDGGFPDGGFVRRDAGGGTTSDAASSADGPSE